MPRILPKMRRGASIVGTVYTGMEVVESATHRAVDYIAVAIICAAMNETIGFLLNDTARLFRRAFNARMRDSGITRSEEHTSELQSLMRISYAVFCLKKQKTTGS